MSHVISLRNYRAGHHDQCRSGAQGDLDTEGAAHRQEAIGLAVFTSFSGGIEFLRGAGACVTSVRASVGRATDSTDRSLD